MEKINDNPIYNRALKIQNFQNDQQWSIQLDSCLRFYDNLVVFYPCCEIMCCKINRMLGGFH